MELPSRHDYSKGRARPSSRLRLRDQASQRDAAHVSRIDEASDQRWHPRRMSSDLSNEGPPGGDGAGRKPAGQESQLHRQYRCGETHLSYWCRINEEDEFGARGQRPFHRF